uniref:VWFA domain-containing protein n=1 Tax=Parastrongyloides trichosuri TaxID=131310 RepID=A0A0N4Z0U3_PARTI
MKAFFKFLSLFFVIFNLINGDCNCGSMNPNPVTSVGGNSFLILPQDANGNDCIPAQPCTYQFWFNVPDNIAIQGLIYNVGNFNSSQATLSFYDGNDASGTPYSVIDGSYEGNGLVNVPASLGKNITIVYNVLNKAGTVPTFTYIASSTTNVRTTTLPPTTTAPIPAGPSNIVPDSYQSEGDIIIFVDLASNLQLLSQVGNDIVNSYYVNTDPTSISSRINLFLASSDQIITFGWSNTKEFSLKQFDNLPNLGINASSIEYTKDLGSKLKNAFEQSATVRPNVQRTLIFLTDNNNQITDQGTPSFANDVNTYDIHPVLINVDPSKDVKSFTKISTNFNGQNTNQLVALNYVNVSDLFENYLFNPVVLCSLNTLGFSGTSSIQLPIQDSTSVTFKNYCNYMNFVVICNGTLPTASDITLKLNSYNFEPNGDFITVYNDQNQPQAIFTGTSITDSTEVIKSTTFVKLVISSNNHRVYQGIDATFTGCTIV